MASFFYNYQNGIFIQIFFLYPGSHIIAAITEIARITEKSDQQSQRSQLRLASHITTTITSKTVWMVLQICILEAVLKYKNMKFIFE